MQLRQSLSCARITGAQQALRPLLRVVALCLPAIVAVGTACNKEEPASPEQKPAVVATPKPTSEPLKFGVLPAVDAAVERQAYAPLMAEIAKALARPVELVIPGSYGALFDQLRKGEIHLGQMSPYIYVRTAGQHLGRRIPTQVVVQEHRADAARHRGVFVVKENSPIQSLAELKGKRFAYVDEGSSSGHYYPRIRLRELKLDPDHFFKETLFAGSHQKTASWVLEGKVDGAAVSEQTLTETKGLRAVERTGVVPDDTIVSLSGISTEELVKLTDFFLKAHTNPALGAFFKSRGIMSYMKDHFDGYLAQKQEMQRTVAARGKP